MSIKFIESLQPHQRWFLEKRIDKWKVRLDKGEWTTDLRSTSPLFSFVAGLFGLRDAIASSGVLITGSDADRMRQMKAQKK